jgi:hypothetical protein
MIPTPEGRTSLEHYARVERERKPGEPFVDALKRVAFEDFRAALGTTTGAAKALGISAKTAFNWSVGELRPVSAPTTERREMRYEARRMRDQAVKMGLVS